MAHYRSTFLFPLFSFIAGFCLMGFEILSSRIIAPLVGASLISWASVIGVTLLGLSLGAYFGGYYADRLKTPLFLFWMTTGSMVGVLMLPLLVVLLRTSAFSSSLMVMSLFFSLVFFFIPSFFMGTLQPIILKASVETFANLGKGYGLLSMAWSLGSIAGVFGIAFIFIKYFSVPSIVVGIAVLLGIITLTLLFFMKPFTHHNRSSLVGAMLVIIFLIIMNLSFDFQKSDTAIYQGDTPYYRVMVADFTTPLLGSSRGLFLDFDSHSIETRIPVHEHYTNVFPVFGVLNPSLEKVLVIGAGAYTMPKKIQARYPNAHVSVVEIDPSLEEIGEQFFYLDTNKITTIHQDARFFMRTTENKYDVIFGDAYNSFISVPWYLTTQEFYKTIADHLNPGGVYAMSFIASQADEKRAVLDMMHATFTSVFSTTYVLAFGNATSETETIVLLGMNEKDPTLSNEAFKKKLRGLGEYAYLETLVIDDVAPSDEGLILTDNYAPLDSTMVHVMRDYYPLFRNFFNKIFFSPL